MYWLNYTRCDSCSRRREVVRAYPIVEKPNSDMFSMPSTKLPIMCSRILAIVVADRLEFCRPLDAAHLDKHRRLKRHALHIVLDTIAVLLRRESGCRPLAGINLQARDAYVFWRGLVRDLKAFLEELIRLRLARAYLSRKSSSCLSQL